MTAPRPLISATARPFWDALREEEIHLQQCTACTQWIFYPRLFCNHCGSDSLAWRPCSNKATLYSFTVAEYPVSPDFVGLPPQWLALVDLDIGVRLPTTLVNVGGHDIYIGMPVHPHFDHSTFEDISLLRFQP